MPSDVISDLFVKFTDIVIIFALVSWHYVHYILMFPRFGLDLYVYRDEQ